MKTYEIKTYPNQRVITLEKAPSDIDNLYGIFNIEELQKASKNMNLSELRVYLYITMNQDGFKFAFSSKDCANKMGGTADKARLALNSLIEKGYLKQINKNEYIFKE